MGTWTNVLIIDDNGDFDSRKFRCWVDEEYAKHDTPTCHSGAAYIFDKIHNPGEDLYHITYKHGYLKEVLAAIYACVDGENFGTCGWVHVVVSGDDYENAPYLLDWTKVGWHIFEQPCFPPEDIGDGITIPE